MKAIAISSEGPGLESRVDPRFGRAAGFVIVNPETLENRYLDNGAAQSRSQGAGILAAETMAKEGVQVVLSGVVGPKALAVLNAAEIQISEGYENMTVGQALERFRSNVSNTRVGSYEGGNCKRQGGDGENSGNSRSGQGMGRGGAGCGSGRRRT